ncbi:MAG: hypothetical protein WKH97_16345 [Casimicrobiaceae bacterium]
MPLGQCVHCLEIAVLVRIHATVQQHPMRAQHFLDNARGGGGYEYERPDRVVVSTGGQIPNNLAMRLAKAGVKVLGTSAECRHAGGALERF